MKLYATTKNEKGKTVSIGGNEMLTIEINKGNRRMIEFYITIETVNSEAKHNEIEELMVIDMLKLSDGSTSRLLEHEFYRHKQKGE